VSDRRTGGVKADVVDRSLAYGSAVADAILACAHGDRCDERATTMEMPQGDGYWVPTGGTTKPPLEPHWGDLRTLVLTSSSECAQSAPPPYSVEPQSTMYAQANAVYQTSKALTEDQRTIALFWADNPGETGTPPGHWVKLTGQVAKEKSLTLDRATELYAKLGIALDDAFIACWHTKFVYCLLRPETYIQRNLDAAWKPIIATPMFPSYTSGHSTASAAAAEVLTTFFGDGVAFVDHTHDDRGLAPRSFASFREAAHEAMMSRLYAGIHYPVDNEAGYAQGACVGTLVGNRVQTAK
jgi:hypothetical protein